MSLWDTVSPALIGGNLYYKRKERRTSGSRHCAKVGRGVPPTSDEDEELQAHGKYYSCNYLLDMEEHQFLVSMHAGKVEEILINPGPLDARFQFIIRASAETWRNFAKEIPPPMYHGIWAASFRGDMSIEGDQLVM